MSAGLSAAMARADTTPRTFMSELRLAIQVRPDPDDESVRLWHVLGFDSFEDYVTGDPDSFGLYSTIDDILRLCRTFKHHDPELLALVDRELRQTRGKRPSGTSAAAAIRRLDRIVETGEIRSRDHLGKTQVRKLTDDELAEVTDKRDAVLAGELSAHRAMLDLGLRRKPVAVQVVPDGWVGPESLTVGSEKWLASSKRYLGNLLRIADRDIEQVVRLWEELETNRAWEFEEVTADAWMREHTGRSRKWFRALAKLLREVD